MIHYTCHYEVFKKSTCLTVVFTPTSAGTPWLCRQVSKREIQEADSPQPPFLKVSLAVEGINMSRSKSSEHQRTSIQTPWQFSSASQVCVFDLECCSIYDNSMAGS